MFWIYFVSCLVLPRVKPFFFPLPFSFLLSCKKSDFQTRREHLSVACSAAFDFCKGRGCCSYNPGQGLIDQVSRQMVLVTCKQEFYYGSLLKPWSRCVAEDGLPTFFSCFFFFFLFPFSFQKSGLDLVFFFRMKAWKCFLFICLFYIKKQNQTKQKTIVSWNYQKYEVTFHVFFPGRLLPFARDAVLLSTEGRREFLRKGYLCPTC